MIRAMAELLVELGIIFAAVWYGIAYHRLKRRVGGLKDPELWLPKRERRVHARKLLQREDDEYMQKLIERTTEFIQKGSTKP